MRIEIFPVKIPIVKVGDDYVGIALSAIKENDIELRDNDVIVIASKVVSTALGATYDLDKMQPSEKAVAIAREKNLDPGYAKIIEGIMRESEQDYGGIAYQKERFLVMWTKKNNALSINAGIDRKNAPLGHVSLEIRDPHKVADSIREEVSKRTGRKVGILISDSTWYPLRNGAIGYTIGLSGFEPVRDCTRNENGNPAVDIYDRPVPIARHDVADDLAAAAHLLMGEAGEKMAVVVIRGAPIKYTDKADVKALYMSEKEDPFFLVFKPTGSIADRPQWRD